MRTQHYLGAGFIALAACASAADGAANSSAVINSNVATAADGSRTVTLELGQAHSLEFTESEDLAWVIETRPQDAATVFPAAFSAPGLYRQYRAAIPTLPNLFEGFPTPSSAESGELVGVTVAALSKADFLAGDHICAHYCKTGEFQEYADLYPFESTEKCRTDLVGKDFDGSAVDTSAVGEKLFFAANSRDAGGTLNVHAYQQRWLFEGEMSVAYDESDVMIRTKVVNPGEATSGSLTVRQQENPNVYTRAIMWADMAGTAEAVYDYYTCAAATRTRPAPAPGN
jgi:hypothetical protein